LLRIESHLQNPFNLGVERIIVNGEVDDVGLWDGKLQRCEWLVGSDDFIAGKAG